MPPESVSLFVVCLVRPWIRVLASVYGGTWKNFTNFLRESGLLILRSTSVGFTSILRSVFPYKCNFFRTRKLWRRDSEGGRRSSFRDRWHDERDPATDAAGLQQAKLAANVFRKRSKSAERTLLAKWPFGLHHSLRGGADLAQRRWRKRNARQEAAIRMRRRTGQPGIRRRTKARSCENDAIPGEGLERETGGPYQRQRGTRTSGTARQRRNARYVHSKLRSHRLSDDSVMRAEEAPTATKATVIAATSHQVAVWKHRDQGEKS